MGALVILHNPFDVSDRQVARLARQTTIRRLVQRHRALRPHTSLRRPGGLYGKRRVREFNRPTVCLLNGRALRRAEWDRVRVGPTDVVTFYAAPLGGQGGVGAIIGIVLAVAIAVAAPYLAGLAIPLLGIAAGSIGASLVTAGIGLALSAVAYGVMSLFAQPPPAAAGGMQGLTGGTTASPTYNLSIQGNAARLEQPIPELIGRSRIFPDFVTQPYVRYEDNEQYIHMLLGISVGEVEVEEDEIRIGDTPITVYEEILYEILEPDEVPYEGIVDARWLPSADIATIDLPGSGEGSPWTGPFAANPPATEVFQVEFDISAPRGLWVFNSIASTGFDAADFDIEIEVQEIDAAGGALGAWTALDTINQVGASQSPLRWTYTYDLPSAGRWQVRIRRNDAEIESSGAGHEVQWIGLRGRLTTDRRFGGMTCMGVRIKATGDLNDAQSRKVNLIATRKLPTWDAVYETMTTELVATRNPCDAFAHIARTENGGRLADSLVDLAGIYEAYDDFEYDGWTFDFVFDQSLTVSEALARVARSVVAERVVQGGKVRLVRDLAATAPVAMFGPRNIRRGSLDLEYKMIDSTSADALVGTMIDPTFWKPVDVTVAFDDSPQERPARMTLAGITNREQMRAVLWNLARANRYRRRLVKFSTEMEGLAVLFGDPIAFSHDVPRWGQTMEMLAWNASTRVATLSDAPVFTPGQTHYVAIRDAEGMLAGPYEATAVDGQDMQLVVGTGTLPEIVTGGDAERTFVQFGPGEEYARRLKVIQVTPKSEDDAEIIAIDDDPRMYEALPPDDDDAPIGGDQDPVEVTITDPADSVNLRTIANANGYVGVRHQVVTITIASGVEVGPVVRGTWPSDYALLTLVNEGTISGNGGAGGAGTVSGAGGPGVTGGTGLDASTGPLTVDNAGGTIRGGGGGGGGAPAITATMAEGGGPGPGQELGAGGGSGGGGRGYTGGSAGAVAAVEFPGAAGTAGTSSAPGTGGAGVNATGEYFDGEGTIPYDYTAPDGGDGGEWGTAGTASGSITGQAAGAAGPAGKAVKGNANITWIDEGTLVGPVA